MRNLKGTNNPKNASAGLEKDNECGLLRRTKRVLQGSILTHLYRQLVIATP